MSKFWYYTGPSSRCVIMDGDERHELHCGECFDLHTSPGVKVPVRIELSGDWILVGVTPTQASAWDGREVTR